MERRMHGRDREKEKDFWKWRGSLNERLKDEGERGIVKRMERE